jgi:hypothetical protein
VPNVFISYRREDSAAAAGRLYDRLCGHFGEEHVFRDIDTITPGTEFATVIEQWIGACDALIAIIGEDWLNATDSTGRRRLDDPRDFVKAEIREALAQKKRVIPALVKDALMPSASDLPPDIAALAGRNAIEISESRFDYDVKRLIKAIDTKTRSPKPRKRDRWWEWLKDSDNQRILTFLGTGLSAAVIAAWTAFVHFSNLQAPEKSMPKVQFIPTVHGESHEITSKEVQLDSSTVDCPAPKTMPGYMFSARLSDGSPGPQMIVRVFGNRCGMPQYIVVIKSKSSQGAPL